MRDQQLVLSNKIAQFLNAEEADVNELSKCIGFLRDNPNSNLFFKYLDTVIAEGRAVVRSGRTLDYYRAIRDACRRYLGPYKDDPKAMAQILGWAARLMRYYAVEDKLGRVVRRPPQKTPRPTTRDDRLTGTVRWFDKERRFGFIEPSGGGEDVFVHLSQTPRQQGLQKNQRVSFVMGKGRKGRPQAQDVQPE